MQEYRNAMNRQQSSQLAKIQQRQQQQIQQQQEQTQKQQMETNQQQQIQQIQQQQEEIQKIQQQGQIQKQQDQIATNNINNNKANPCYTASEIAQIYAERHWSEQLINDDSVFLFVLSTQGDVLYCSDTCQELTGYHAIDVVSHPISEFLHPDDQSQFYALLERVFETPLRLSSINFRWKMKTSPTATPTTTFVSMQCFGYSKPDDVPSFTLTSSNDLQSSYYAFFALAQIREPTTADVLVQLKTENQRLEQQLALFASMTVTSQPQPQPQPPPPLPSASSSSTSSVISTWMQSADISSIPWVAPMPPPLSQSAFAQADLSQYRSKIAMLDDHGSTATISYQQTERTSKQTIKPTKTSSVDEDNTKKKKKVYVTLEEHQCTDCGTTNSPEWRKGPFGRKTLCNACGLRWAKKNKKVNTLEDR